MAETNPTHGRRAVPLDLPPSQVKILCGLLDDWREDIQRDLEHVKGVKDPDLTRSEAEAFERLAAEVAKGEILVPDETARTAVEAAAKAYDEASEYTEVIAHHDALHGLLAALTVEAA
jgi:4-aminobutyrate aminotransferase-like enzyme